MREVIYYFSGTGNSLYIAKLLSSELNFSYRRVSKHLKDEQSLELINQIVLVFPMYNHSYPLIVKDFLITLSQRISLSQIHFSAVCTYGNGLGITLIQLDKLLQELGASLSLGYGIKMPYNYVEPIGFKIRGFLDSFIIREHSDLEIKAANELAQCKVREIARLISEKGFAEPEASSVFIESLVVKLGLQNTVQKKVWAKVGGSYTTKEETFYDMVKHMDDGFSINEKCVKCGVCSSVCPVDNIIKGNDGKPEFKHDCEQCFACVAWCPAQAIDFRNSTIERRRYHNTEISVTDMLMIDSD